MSKESIMNFFSDHQAEVIQFGKAIILLVIVLFIAWIVLKIIKSSIKRAVMKVPNLDEAVANAIYSAVRVLIWLLAFLIILDLFGVNTASILTVLGAAGLAIGLAMKDSLSNIAAGIMLLVLRPYKIGDYVDCGTVSGTIKEMGLFSTVLETVDGLFIAAPNSAVFAAPVKNYSRNPLRRVDIPVGLAYGDSLPKAIETMQGLMAQTEKILKDQPQEVLIAELAESSVQLNLRFWTKTEDYWEVYWQVKSQLKPTIEAAGLHIPYPHRVITMVKES